MKNIKVELLNYSPLNIVVKGIRQCYDSCLKSDSNNQKIGPNDTELIRKVINKFKHESVMEHIFYNFSIQNISRLCLQELVRHRIASYSVKSTRYTLKELRNVTEINFDSAEKFIVLLSGSESITGLNERTSAIIDYFAINNLRNLKILINFGYCLDGAKYALPECYRTSLSLSINARSLKNFLKLRLSKNAHFEIRYLAKLISESIERNTDHKILYEDITV